MESFLETHPQYVGKVVLLQIAVPTRTDVPGTFESKHNFFMHVCTHTHTHTHTHTYIYIYIYICVCVCVWIYIYMYIYIPHKLLAMESFLETHPQYVGKVVFLQIAVPIRTDVPDTSYIYIYIYMGVHIEIKRIHIYINKCIYTLSFLETHPQYVRKVILLQIAVPTRTDVPGAHTATHTQTVHIQKETEHTRTGNWSESGFGSLRGAPLNISKCSRVGVDTATLVAALHVHMYVYMLLCTYLFTYKPSSRLIHNMWEKSPFFRLPFRREPTYQVPIHLHVHMCICIDKYIYIYIYTFIYKQVLVPRDPPTIRGKGRFADRRSDTDWCARYG